jgi:hypothetical protein
MANSAYTRMRGDDIDEEIIERTAIEILNKVFTTTWDNSASVRSKFDNLSTFKKHIVKRLATSHESSTRIKSR